MTLNDTMQHYTTVYKTIQHYNYKAIRHHTTPYNVIQDYTTIYKAIRNVLRVSVTDRLVVTVTNG